MASATPSDKVCTHVSTPTERPVVTSLPPMRVHVAGRAASGRGGGECGKGGGGKVIVVLSLPADGATAKPSAAKVTDWASVKWNELGQTSDSR